jgi:FkbM family methyltransferase
MEPRLTLVFFVKLSHLPPCLSLKSFCQLGHLICDETVRWLEMSNKSIILSLVSKATRLMPGGIKRSLYQLGPVSRLIRGFLNKISPPGLSVVTVSGGALQGIKMILDLQLEKDYWLGTYEVDLQEAIRSGVEEGWVAYDIGANIGYLSFVLAKAVGKTGQVFAFEALPANLDRLRENILLNGLDSRVKIIPGAVTDVPGKVKFLVGPSKSMGKVAGSAGRVGLYDGEIEVPGIALDAFVYDDGHPVPQVVKIDIEGGEVMALRGMTRLVSEARPLIFLELHGPEAARVAWEVLTSAGYSICRMEKDLSPIPSQADLNWKAYLVGVP